ncbi:MULTISPECIES: hypothetical protein [Kordiimonas]|jgi:hypothetical protein|nr:hypothetical protein [Kordiimonas sp. UBA4487]
MNELNVTHLWMGGVVAMMLVFGAFALVGYLRQKSDAPDDTAN